MVDLVAEAIEVAVGRRGGVGLGWCRGGTLEGVWTWGMVRANVDGGHQLLWVFCVCW